MLYQEQHLKASVLSWEPWDLCAKPDLPVTHLQMTCSTKVPETLGPAFSCQQFLHMQDKDCQWVTGVTITQDLLNDHLPLCSCTCREPSALRWPPAAGRGVVPDSASQGPGFGSTLGCGDWFCPQCGHVTAQLGALKAVPRSQALPAVGEPGTELRAQQTKSCTTGTSRDECTWQETVNAEPK